MPMMNVLQFVYYQHMADISWQHEDLPNEVKLWLVGIHFQLLSFQLQKKLNMI